MFLLENFSNEVLELIFFHVRLCKETLECTEISPRINNVISNSIKIMNKVPIIWNSKKDDMKAPVNTRKYSDVRIQDVSQCSSQLKFFFATHSDTLTCVWLENCSIAMADLHALLSLVAANLTIIVFWNATLTDQKQLPKIEMPKLNHLQLFKSPEGSDVKVFISIINTCSLISLIYDKFGDESSPAPSEEAVVLIEFITQQRSLFKLTLVSSIADAATKYWFEEKPLAAKLQNLDIRYIRYNCRCNDVNFLHFKALVESKKDSLRELTVMYAHFEEERIHYLLSLQLNSLKMVYCSLEWNSERLILNNTIKQFYFIIHFRDPDDATVLALNRMLTSCESISELMISFDKSEERFLPLLETVAKKTSVTTLTVSKPVCLNATTFPAVKTVSFMNFHDDLNCGEVEKLLKANPQLTNVNFSNKPKDENFIQMIKEILQTLSVRYDRL